MIPVWDDQLVPSASGADGAVVLPYIFDEENWPVRLSATQSGRHDAEDGVPVAVWQEVKSINTKCAFKENSKCKDAAQKDRRARREFIV